MRPAPTRWPSSRKGCAVVELLIAAERAAYVAWLNDGSDENRNAWLQAMALLRAEYGARKPYAQESGQ